MGYLNDSFLEEFKSLDQLFRDMYQTDRGVTSYIDEMRQVPQAESRSISNWEWDLRHLVELRHLRNRLSHEIGTLNEEQCSMDEINWLRSFHQRVLTQSDPLAQLYVKRSEGPPADQAAPTTPPYYSAPCGAPQPPKRSRGCPAAWAAFICCALTSASAVILYWVLLSP